MTKRSALPVKNSCPLRARSSSEQRGRADSRGQSGRADELRTCGQSQDDRPVSKQWVNRLVRLPPLRWKPAHPVAIGQGKPSEVRAVARLTLLLGDCDPRASPTVALGWSGQAG